MSSIPLESPAPHDGSSGPAFSRPIDSVLLALSLLLAVATAVILRGAPISQIATDQPGSRFAPLTSSTDPSQVEISTQLDRPIMIALDRSVDDDYALLPQEKVPAEEDARFLAQLDGSSPLERPSSHSLSSSVLQDRPADEPMRQPYAPFNVVEPIKAIDPIDFNNLCGEPGTQDPAESVDQDPSADALDPGIPDVASPGSGTEASDPPAGYRVRDEYGRSLIGRLYETAGNRVALMLPDGRIGWTNRLVRSEEPFQPWTAQELVETLHPEEFADFEQHVSDHYVIFYQCSRRFAEDSAKLLESLYEGLKAGLAGRGLPTRDSEFPLIAVIYATERDFRDAHPARPEVQAFYDLMSNRVIMYERAENHDRLPEISRMRQPQIVAHEGTHQILSNIGVQPRLAPWPPWLIEGLAEFCAPTTTKRNAVWAGVGHVNAIHMSVIADVQDPARLALPDDQSAPRLAPLKPGQSLVESLVRRASLTPTDYAFVWALTHYLAVRQSDPFFAYLRRMGELTPLEARTSDQHLDDFREAFGADLNRLDRAVRRHLDKLRYEPLPYYLVRMERQIRPDVVHRQGLISQSPVMILQWLDRVLRQSRGPTQWGVSPFRNRTRARIALDAWLQGGS